MVDIRRAVAITFEGKTWFAIPDIVDKQEVIQLSTKDESFSKFLTGKVRGLHGARYLDNLKYLRDEAVIKLGASASTGGLFDEPDVSSNYKRRKAVEYAKQSSDNGSLPPFVDVDMPEAVVEGTVIQGAKAKVATEVDTKPLMVILNDVALTHIFKMLKYGPRSEARTREQSNTHTTWDNKKNAYIARNMYTKQSMTFRPLSDCPEDKATAKARASAWATRAAAQAEDDVAANHGEANGDDMQASDSS